MTEAIVVEDLVKKFGGFTAVDGVSFAVPQGEIFGILGPNGAGKTTTLEIIEGLQEPTAGRTLVMGIDTHRERERMKERIGVQLQASAYFEYLTLTEILDLFGRFYPKRLQVEELLEKVGLLEKAKATVGKLSGGQKQRFTIAAALVNDPEVVFLDEPTTGLDPQARRNLWEFIQAIHREGRTIVLTTHYMEEAQLLCQRVAIMDRGKIIALDAPNNLIRGLP
ncbi:MAG: ABC transporter ATP-binding protein, partial [Chloroflexi bacterium]|nr:ABC transporter ATP-binding protein [Chloroflexota bacterium]